MTEQREAFSAPLAVQRADRIPTGRYFDRDFFEAEAALLWPRVWQMACRLEEIPSPGDAVEYTILDQSVFVARQEDGSVRAFENACRHRGVQLIEGRRNVRGGVVCSFHGWRYGLDGASTYVYQPDLFVEDNVCARDLALREVRVELWGGCAFVNFDEDAPPLRESIEPFASFHDAWCVDALRTKWWYACVLPVNWKLAMEAFMEGYHVVKTHPQLKPPRVSRLASGRYREVADRVGAAEPSPAPVFDARAYVESSIDFMRVLSEGMAGMVHPDDVAIAEGLRDVKLPSDPSAAAEWRRLLNDAIVAHHRTAGATMPDLNALEASGLTSAVNYCFPHFFLLPMYSAAASYRIRPLGPEESLFEIWSLARYAPGAEPPPPAAPTPWSPGDARWPPIPLQDFSNLPRQQRGLHTRGLPYLRLSDKVEGMIGNYHRLIDGYLAGLDHERLLHAAQQVSGPIDAPVRDLGF